MSFANIGAKPVHGIQMNINVDDASGTSVFSSNSDSTTLAVLDTSAYLASLIFAPSSVGVYDMEFWGSGDSISNTSIESMTAIITDSVYGRDYGNPAGAWRVGRSCGGLQLGNKFDVYTSDEITSVSAYIADYSVAGAEIFGVVYEVDITGGTTTYFQLDQTDDYELESSDIDGWVTIPFNQATSISAGQQYMLCIGGYVHPLDTFGINVSGDAEVTMSMIMDDGSGCELGSATSFPAWYWIGDVPMIRMNFGNHTTSIVETLFEGVVELYPNPTYGNITLELNDVLIDKYSISVKNLLGQEIYSIEKIVNGSMKQNIDLSNYSRGSYIVTITNSLTSISQKIIIE